MIIIFQRHQAPSDDLSPSTPVFHPDKILYECLFHQIDPIKMYQNSSFVNLSLSNHNNVFTFKIWPKMVCEIFLEYFNSDVERCSFPFLTFQTLWRCKQKPRPTTRSKAMITLYLRLYLYFCSVLYICVFIHSVPVFWFFVYYVNICSVVVT